MIEVVSDYFTRLPKTNLHVTFNDSIKEKLRKY